MRAPVNHADFRRSVMCAGGGAAVGMRHGAWCSGCRHCERDGVLAECEGLPVVCEL